MNTQKNFEKGTEPFVTQDAELASALLTAGCSLEDAENGGPAQMLFTPDICRNRWVTRRLGDAVVREPLLPHSGQTPERFEKAVMLAVRLGIPGVVNYMIKRDALFVEAMKMHDRLAAEAAAAEHENRPMSLPPLAALSEAEQAVVVCYVNRKNRKDLASYSWLRSPMLCMGKVQKALVPKAGVSDSVASQMSFTVEGSGKVWSLDLSNEKRATPTPDGKPFLHPKPTL